jgi:hypothetical protein
LEKRSELEPEPEFLTSWSRSRTKMNRLRNTGNQSQNDFREIPGKVDIGAFLNYIFFISS